MFYDKITKGIKSSINYILKLVRTYSIWTLIYWIYKWYIGEFNCSIVGAIYLYITGSFYHLWYFPAVILSAVLVYLTFRLKVWKILFSFTIPVYAVGVIGCAYYEFVIQIPGLNILYSMNTFEIFRRFICMGLVFFGLGFWLRENMQRVASITISRIIVIIGVVVFCAEMFFVVWLDCYDNIVITFGLYILVLGILMYLYYHPGNGSVNRAKVFRKLAAFIYFVHPLIVGIFNRYLQINSVGTYFGVVLICILLGLSLIKINWKMTNMLLG